MSSEKFNFKIPYIMLKARTHYANLPSADSSGVKILNIFDKGSWPTITEPVV